MPTRTSAVGAALAYRVLKKPLSLGHVRLQTSLQSAATLAYRVFINLT